MAFLILGLALLGMKMADFGPVAAWSWWVVLLPFGLAVAWWSFADSSGLTQRRAIDKMEKRKADRRERALHNLGLGVKGQPGHRRAPEESRTRTRDTQSPPPPASRL